MKNRKRNRMKGFDYSSNNIYFVTICVQNRECCFGYVGTGCDLSVHHPNENHPNENHSNENHPNENHPNENHPNDDKKNDFSGIKMNLNEYGKIVDEQIIWLEEQYQYAVIHNYAVMPNHVHIILEIDSLKVKDSTTKIKSLSSLIGAFKTTSSKIIHKKGLENFAWQRSFHDHIIRNEKAYDTIFNYIDLNPEKWFQDCFF
ncbi:transposase [Flavobacterium restrictum]|nr:transposase [Flavobacterium restrictum]